MINSNVITETLNLYILNLKSKNLSELTPGGSSNYILLHYIVLFHTQKSISMVYFDIFRFGLCRLSESISKVQVFLLKLLNHAQYAADNYTKTFCVCSVCHRKINANRNI